MCSKEQGTQRICSSKYLFLWNLRLASKKTEQILFEKEFLNLNIYLKLIIWVSENKNIILFKQNLSDIKIHPARKIRTDVFSQYRKMSSLGAPERRK